MSATTDTPTSDRTALYAAICAAPGEDTPRLVLADWLDEYGDSASADLAEFIRVHVELASIDPDTEVSPSNCLMFATPAEAHAALDAAVTALVVERAYPVPVPA